MKLFVALVLGCLLAFQAVEGSNLGTHGFGKNKAKVFQAIKDEKSEIMEGAVANQAGGHQPHERSLGGYASYPRGSNSNR